MRDSIDKYLGYFLVLLMSVMALDVLWGVITRYAMGSQADWSEELARFLLIWIGLLGAAYASGQRVHLAIDILSANLNTSNRRKLSMTINALIVLFSVAILIIGGAHLMYLTKVLGQLSAALRIPMYIVYAALPISGLLIVFYKMHDLFRLLQIRKAGSWK